MAMNFPYLFARTDCPPVFRVYTDAQPVERRTLIRVPGEADHQFADRAQRTAYRMWLRAGCNGWARIECVYDVPTPQQDPHFFDDDRWSDLACLRAVLDRPDEPAEVRVACAKALNRIHGMVNPGVW
jgi:hypothetical protein